MLVELTRKCYYAKYLWCTISYILCKIYFLARLHGFFFLPACLSTESRVQYLSQIFISLFIFLQILQKIREVTKSSVTFCRSTTEEVRVRRVKSQNWENLAGIPIEVFPNLKWNFTLFYVFCLKNIKKKMRSSYRICPNTQANFHISLLYYQHDKIAKTYYCLDFPVKGHITFILILYRTDIYRKFVLCLDPKGIIIVYFLVCY